MPCTRVGNAIICTRTHTRRCACGRAMTRECDWKVKTRKSGTCDKALCDRCTHVPAEGKDLCPKHAAMWADRQGRQQVVAT